MPTTEIAQIIHIPKSIDYKLPKGEQNYLFGAGIEVPTDQAKLYKWSALALKLNGDPIATYEASEPLEENGRSMTRVRIGLESHVSADMKLTGAVTSAYNSLLGQAKEAYSIRSFIPQRLSHLEDPYIRSVIADTVTNINISRDPVRRKAGTVFPNSILSVKLAQMSEKLQALAAQSVSSDRAKNQPNELAAGRYLGSRRAVVTAL